LLEVAVHQRRWGRRRRIRLIDDQRRKKLVRRHERVEVEADPCGIARDARVDTGEPRLRAAVTEADDAYLNPLFGAVIIDHQRAAAVALARILATLGQPGADHVVRQAAVAAAALDVGDDRHLNLMEPFRVIGAGRTPIAPAGHGCRDAGQTADAAGRCVGERDRQRIAGPRAGRDRTCQLQQRDVIVERGVIPTRMENNLAQRYTDEIRVGVAQVVDADDHVQVIDGECRGRTVLDAMRRRQHPVTGDDRAAAKLTVIGISPFPDQCRLPRPFAGGGFLPADDAGRALVGVGNGRDGEYRDDQ